jgi:hypothetical protein
MPAFCKPSTDPAARTENSTPALSILHDSMTGARQREDDRDDTAIGDIQLNLK